MRESLWMVQRTAGFDVRYGRETGAGGMPAPDFFSGHAAAEDFGNGLGSVIKIDFSADFEQFGDADVAKLRPHAEVCDSECLDLARVVGVATASGYG